MKERFREREGKSSNVILMEFLLLSEGKVKENCENVKNLPCT